MQVKRIPKTLTPLLIVVKRANSGASHENIFLENRYKIPLGSVKRFSNVFKNWP